ncbi:MAG: EVE domain-containing protein [Gemmatimonadales bacterium]|nr:EVE domain-containing protein [Gemmatimonadales bacterium]
MPQYWILKTEPSEFAFGDLQRAGRTRWDGVTNALALKHLRSMRPGDRVLVYHTGDEKRLVGMATVVGEPYPDPSAGDERVVVVDLEAGDELPETVTLAAIKADPAFKDLGLVRLSRLSVVPVPGAEWKLLLRMAGVG